MKKIFMNIVVMLSLTTIGQAGNLTNLEKRCSSGDGTACATLGAVYSGLGVKSSIKKDMKKAAAFWGKGCDLNNGSSCVTYSMVVQDDNERIKVLKKACDLGNENGCLAYDQTVMMLDLQEECVEKGKLESCRRMGEEVFLSGEYSQGKGIIKEICDFGDDVSCAYVKKIDSLFELRKLPFANDLAKKCKEKKDKYACEKYGDFLVGVTSLSTGNTKNKEEKKKALTEVMMNMTLGMVYLKESCALGRKEACRKYKGLNAVMKNKKGGK